MNSLKSILDEKVLQYNTPAFIENDPVQFPRLYTKKQDIEIVSFLVAHISWGKRTMILRDAERMLKTLGQSPYQYVINEHYKNLGSGNIHRTFFEHDLKYFLGGFKNIFRSYDTVEDFLKANKAKSAWDVASLLLNEMLLANNGIANRYCLPTNPENSAIKRINMALRWLVRNDGIVDIGLWKIFSPSQLFIPLDVHVANVSRELGLLTRKSNDRRAVEELTLKLRQFCPEDPIKYDFALFSTGIDNSTHAH